MPPIFSFLPYIYPFDFYACFSNDDHGRYGASLKVQKPASNSLFNALQGSPDSLEAPILHKT